MNPTQEHGAFTELLLHRLGTGVRETLHNLMGLVELAMQEPLTAAQAEHLSQCRTLSDRLLRVANDVAELATPYDWPAGEPAVSLATMVEELSRIAQARAEHRGLIFRLHVDGNVPADAVVDGFLVPDMIHRLLENSLHAAQSGCVQLRVCKEPMAGASDSLLFEVADSGTGFPPGICSGGRVPMSLEQNRGLGLAVVRRRAEGLGGSFRIASSSPEGAVVQLRIPLRQAQTQIAPRPHQSAMPLRVLVVEDCDESYLLFQTYLSGSGHEIVREVDGARAVGRCQHEVFNLVVMDVNMPVMDGYTATRAIRDWETVHARTRVPIVLLSADDPSRQKRLGAAAGCSGYLTKPIPKADLLAALDYYAT
ncbi:MAG: response regulator [Bryobacterales bacterium]|nr:response regulator [Bryobacterales bacterium]